jgi:DNA-binding NarL/FixJ family response regulator
MRTLSVLIADHSAMRTGIRMALGDGVEVCAEASTAEETIAAAVHHRPDLCLLGREIGENWVDAVRGLSAEAPETAVVLLSHVSDVDDLLEAVRAGAIGYAPGPLDAPSLNAIVVAIAAGEAVIPSSMLLELLIELRLGARSGTGLTTRETEVLGMLRRGHTTAAIAERLAIAPVTVRRHVSELVQKLGVENRAALVGRKASGSFASSP